MGLTKTTMSSEIAEVKKALATMLLTQKDVEYRKNLESSGNQDVINEAYEIIFSSVFPMCCEIIDEGYISPSLALVKCNAMGVGIRDAINLIRSGLHSCDPVFTLSDPGLVLTPNGRKATIRAVRAVKRYTLTNKIPIPENVEEVLNSVLHKTELELI